MKILFVVYHILEEHSGISKKILSQVEGLRRNGAEVHLCTLTTRHDGSKARTVDGIAIREFGRGVKAKIARRISYSDISEYARKERISLTYIRYDINSDPFTVHFIKALKRTGSKVYVEIPTWPYDGEFRGQSTSMHIQLSVDRIFRRSFFRQADKVVTFSDEKTIFGVSTLRISNGIDFRKVPLKRTTHPHEDSLHIISVANIHLWHGLDRLIKGMGEHPEIPVTLHIVGDGIQEIIDSYVSLASVYGIADRVKILGPMYGEALDREFDWADIAAGSLGRHRSGITSIKTLKNREYAARGLAFFYSEDDSDFDDKDYVMKVSADETPVDIRAVARFAENIGDNPSQIRAGVAHLSWDAQMRQVIESHKEG